ncbi:hypothetical protein Tco_1428257 [Tanacetum coccineum]
MDSNFTNENDPWEYSLDIDDSDLHLTPVLRSSSSAHVEPSPYTPNPVTIIPGPAGVVQLSNSICVEPSSSTPNPVRIIPGPAGLVQRAKLLKENVFILDPDGALMSTQEYMQKVVEDVGEDADFNSGAWVSATNYVNAFGGTVTGCLGDIDNFLKKGKLEQVVAIVKSCSPNALGDLNVTLKDLSGTVPGTIHYKVLDVSSYEKDITVGAAMILANVLVFTPKPSKHYLNITKRNVVEVFHFDRTIEILRSESVTVPRNLRFYRDHKVITKDRSICDHDEPRMRIMKEGFDEPVMEQFHEMLRILGQYTQHNLMMDEAISVAELDNNPKGKNQIRSSSVNMVEGDGVKNSKNNKNKRKFKSGDDKFANKKGTMTCWKCNKPGHMKKDCHSRKDKDGDERLKEYLKPKMKIWREKESRDAIFDEERFTSIPRPRGMIQPSSSKIAEDEVEGTDDVPGPSVPRKSTRTRKAKSFGSDFQSLFGTLRNPSALMASSGSFEYFSILKEPKEYGLTYRGYPSVIEIAEQQIMAGHKQIPASAAEDSGECSSRFRRVSAADSGGKIS